MAGAIALIDETGLGNLSLRQVARRVGVSHNAPYRHFEDKEALLAALAEEGFLALQDAMATAREPFPVGTSQRLAAIGMAYVKFAIAHPAHYRLMFGEYRCDFNQNSTLATAARGSFQVLVDTVLEGQKAGLFRPAEPLDMARVAWSLVHGQAMLALDGKLQVAPDQLDAFLQFSNHLLVEGLKANP
ncbi:MAG: TetR/AcrR family transcriptional regulator [Leptolyngbyaceae cyanobacterium SM2_3_12]|nr:TetR/AcrR family transcriptional regulator [Leptolyngbyaceae cyanobacterium SM2_3_12]